jgi:hypothetical protein
MHFIKQCVVWIVITTLVLWGCITKRPDYKTFPQSEYLVGATYFSGWWEGEYSKWVTDGEDWREEYPERVPLLGQVNAQACMDAEIAAAADYGLDFFQFLWYPCYNTAEIPAPVAEHANEGVAFFMASPASSRMRFFVEYCNHEPFSAGDEATWAQACAELVSFMRHPSYLRVGGRAVLKIHSVRVFAEQCGGVETALERLYYLRKLAARGGVGKLLLGAGTWMDDDLQGIDELLAAFDYLQFYNGAPNPGQREEDYPFADLTQYTQDKARWYAENAPLPVLPYVMAGWNAKPWQYPNANFSLPNRVEWADALTQMKLLIDSDCRLRLPNGTRKGQKILNIYAWNEYGEGGVIAPNQGDGYMKLEVIREVFG